MPLFPPDDSPPGDPDHQPLEDHPPVPESARRSAQTPASDLPQAPTGIPLGAPDSPIELHAFLGPGTSFVGTLSFAGTVRIDGTVEGEIRGGKMVIVGPSAVVRGTIVAETVLVLGGEVEAEITAHASVELRVPAIVSGRVHSPQVYMDPGIQFSGICDMQPTRPDD